MFLKIFIRFILCYLINLSSLILASDIEIQESFKCINLFNKIEDQYLIPRDALHSISLKESGKKHSIHKIIIPWPWTVNIAGEGHYFSNKNEAVRFVKRKIIEGKENIDIGCMQISLKHHIDAFDSIEEAFEPINNILYAAKFLKTKYNALKNWHQAIAQYHSNTLERGFKYKQEVFKIANKIDIYKNSFYEHLYNSEDSNLKYSIINNNISVKPRNKFKSGLMVPVFVKLE